MTEVETPATSVEDFFELVKEWLASDQGPQGAGLELLTPTEFDILAAFFAEGLYKIHCAARDLGRREGRAEVENWRRGVEKKWPLWAGIRGN